MATDATGTPTPLGIPTYNVNVDAPSGNGFNEAMTEIDTLIQARAFLPQFSKNTSSVSASGTSFAAGSDLLGSAISVVVPTGGGTYLVRFSTPEATIGSALGTVQVNADGAADGTMATVQGSISGLPLTAETQITLTSGTHTVNVRAFTSNGSIPFDFNPNISVIVQRIA